MCRIFLVSCSSCHTQQLCDTWWRHQMETITAALAICAGNSPVACEFPAQWPVTRSFDVYNGEAGDLRRHRFHYDVIVMSPRAFKSGSVSHSRRCPDIQSPLRTCPRHDTFSRAKIIVVCHGNIYWYGNVNRVYPLKSCADFRGYTLFTFPYHMVRALLCTIVVWVVIARRRMLPQIRTNCA